MANLDQQLEDLGVLNAEVLGEASNLPGFSEIQAGHQLSPEQNFVFRNAVAKTILIYHEKEAARLKFLDLMYEQTLKEWVRSFAPFAKDVTSALHPIIKLNCYYMNWPYAEVWSQNDTPGSRTLRVAKSFSYPFQSWFSIERAIEELATYMGSYSITLPSRELPGEAFTSNKKLWGELCLYKTKDMKRRKLLKQASLKYACVVPLKDRHQNTTHALVFYAPVFGPRSRSAKKFLFPTAQDAVDVYTSVEVIQADEKEAFDKTMARCGKTCARIGGIRSARIGDSSPMV